MKNTHLLLFLAMMALVSCTGSNYRKTARGILVNNGKDAVLLEVMTPRIVHVFAFRGLQMPDKKSLIVNDSLPIPARWEVGQQGENVLLSTDSIQVSIDKQSLQVVFMNRAGKILLAEKNGGGRSFEPARVNGDTVLSLRQEFEEDKDQALFGLGQHQDRLLNLMGRELSFNQKNREIFIPFLVSTKGYGLLWDNYSFTRYGSLQPSEKIPATLLYDGKGKFGGLSVKWFSDPSFQKTVLSDQQQAEPMDLPGDLADKILSARYEGELEIPETGEYQFENKGKQYFRLWIDNLLVRDFWSSFVLATDYTRLNLEKGRHAIRIEWSRNNSDEIMTFSWRKPEMHENGISLWSQAGKGIDYYFVYGPTADQVIGGYRALTGKASMLPRWAYGFWQSRERYMTQNELVSVVEEFRKRKVPLDVIVQDWQYWRPGEWGSHIFDPLRFPDPSAAIEKIHDLRAKVLLSVWPKFYTNVQNFKDLHDQGYIYPANLQDSTRDWLGHVSVYYDAYHPRARDLYWEQINKTLVPTGVDGWWLDASEPEVVSDATPDDMAARMSPNYFGSGVEYLNAYSLFHSRGVYEHQRKVKPEERVCILTRSAFAGQQANGAISWSGDVTSRWDVLKAQVAAGLSFSISGIPYWTSDIGAFSVDYPGGNANPEYQELFTRWYQFGTFCPIFRVHGTNTPREIWFFGSEESTVYQTQLLFDRLRYRLLPYIYSIAGEVNRVDYTVMRPLAMDFPQEQIVWDIADQYMFGPALMVCPVTEKGATDRPVYLPAGKGWYDFWFGHLYQGGNSLSASAPLNKIPLFVKAGSILPIGPAMQFSSENKSDTLRLMVYTGDSGSFTLYEDDGTTYQYESNKYSLIPILWDENAKTLTIEKRTGNFRGLHEKRVFELYLVTPNRPLGYDDPGVPDKRINYDGTAIQIIMK